MADDPALPATAAPAPLLRAVMGKRREHRRRALTMLEHPRLT